MLDGEVVLKKMLDRSLLSDLQANYEIEPNFSPQI